MPLLYVRVSSHPGLGKLLALKEVIGSFITSYLHITDMPQLNHQVWGQKCPRTLNPRLSISGP